VFNAGAPVAASLILRLIRDDGVIVYLNGVEIHRDNLPDGEIVYGTTAVDTSVSRSGIA
jgi:hypothetical protein